MIVRIVSRDNGWGLSRDVAVLTEAIKMAIPDAQVSFLDWQARPSGKVDVQFFLELLPAHLFQGARRNVLVPNPEWFMREWMRLIPMCTEVWAKTADCARVFRSHHRRVRMTGWTSPDRMLQDVPRTRTIVHLAGNSSAKGTEQVMAAMRLLPDLSLTLVSKKKWNAPPNVRTIDHLPEDAFRRLQNEARIHLCPSSYEGYGHYINEALSCGALVITTAAEPMTDLVHSGFGIGAKVSGVSRQNLATHQHVDPESLADCIRMANDCSDDTLEALGRRARSSYIATRSAFHAQVADLLR